jgi:hypothetical protein
MNLFDFHARVAVAVVSFCRAVVLTQGEEI